jgi:hypothetical protein
MNIADLPTLVPIPFGNSAGGSYIRTVPVPSQIGVSAGAASFTDGFTPDTFTPLGGGGAYVNGEDMNGILNHVTKWTRWLSAGGAAVYNSAFATGISGYPKGAVLASTAFNGTLWMSTVDGNLTNPDGGSPVGWDRVGPVEATLAQAVAGTSDTTFISPSILKQLLGFGNGLVASPGYMYLTVIVSGVPTQVIVQWGQYNFTSDRTVTVNFPLRFPATALWFSPGMIQTSFAGNQNNVTLEGGALSATGYTAYCRANGDNNPMQMNWIAIGF